MRSTGWTHVGQNVPPGVVLLVRVAVLLLPAALLIVGCLNHTGAPAIMLAMGAGFQLVVCALTFVTRRAWRMPLGPSVIVLYVIALGWICLGAAEWNNWFTYLSQAVLLVVPLIVFAFQTLRDSGAPALRRARLLADRVARRQDWPTDFGACRSLPEVKALRESLHLDAAPALVLLHHPRVQVRVAALAALEFRQNWRPGQAEMILQLAQQTREPAVRAAAISALGNLHDRLLVELLAEFFSDNSWEVRRATADALLWDTEHRWSWIRHAVRRSLANPLFHDDGPLHFDSQLLAPEALKDLTAWASEKGVLGVRAASTLGVHYNRALSERVDDTLLQDLRTQLSNPHAAPALRIELGRLLRQNQELDHNVLEKLLNSANPAPLRLMAVETLLGEGDHADAVLALRDLARLPNREIALATADVVQRRLGIDLGLAVGQPLPPVHSRLAAEVTRRVMMWAAQEARPQQVESRAPEVAHT
jgi:HEAT repeat protein